VTYLGEKLEGYFFNIDLIVIDDLPIEKYKDFLGGLILIGGRPKWKTQKLSLWWVTFSIEKYKDFSGGLILMGGLPRWKNLKGLIMMSDISN